MGQIIRPGSSHSSYHPIRRGPFFFVSLYQEFGSKAVVVLVAAALVALASRCSPG